MPANPIFRYTRPRAIVPLTAYERDTVRALDLATRKVDVGYVRGLMHKTRCLLEHHGQTACAGALLDTLVPVVQRTCDADKLLEALCKFDTRLFDDGLYGEDAFSLCTLYSAAEVAARVPVEAPPSE